MGMRRVDAGDVQVAVRERGDARRPTVVLMHGYPDTGAVWDEVAERLSDRFHVVTYDVRGMGESSSVSGAGAFRMDRLLADLAAVLDEVCPERPVHIVGHDWGAMQGWAALRDERLAGRIASLTSLGGVSLEHFAGLMRRTAASGPAGAATAARQLARSGYIGFLRLPRLPEAVLGAVSPKVVRAILATEGVRSRQGHPAPTLSRDLVAGIGLYRDNTFVKRQPALSAPDTAPASAETRSVEAASVEEGGAGARDSRSGDRGGWDAGVGGRARVRRGAGSAVPVQVVVAVRDRYLGAAAAEAQAVLAETAWVRRVATGHWVQRTRPTLLARWIGEFVDAVERGAVASRTTGILDGQLAVVTGAGSGIGRATAVAFAAAGATVVAADVDEGAAESTAAEVGGHPYQVDVADPEAMERFAAYVREMWGVPDVVVNNAGIAVAGALLDTDEADWERIRSVNLDGVYRGCRLFGKQMAERGEGGQLVNLASMAAFAPSVGLPAYSATKAAVLQLSECLRAELKPYGIGVTAICPGVINTPITRNTTYVGVTAAAADRLRKQAATVFHRRGYGPERVAQAILRAVERDRAVAPVTPEAYAARALARLSPGAARTLAAVASRAAAATGPGDPGLLPQNSADPEPSPDSP